MCVNVVLRLILFVLPLGCLGLDSWVWFAAGVVLIVVLVGLLA